MIQFHSKECRDLSFALSREWLETNGLGGFSSSTIIGLNTRRYHGLLTAATNPPLGRLLLLSQMEEILWIDGKSYSLSCHQYPGTVYPQGYQYLKEFRLDPFPIFTYVVEGIEIEKNIFMVHKENTTVIQYQFRSAGIRNGELRSPLDKNVIFELRPLIAFRDYHATTRFNATVDSKLQIQEQLITISPYPKLPSLSFAHDADVIDSNSFWFYNFEYEKEKERGLDFSEDLFSPFALKFNISSRRTIASVIASTIRNDIKEVGIIRHAELHRRKDIMLAAPFSDDFTRQLVNAGDQFIVNRQDQKTVIAGYHWFGDWGRDTMIALPGLTLATGRFDVAKSILLTFVGCVDQGMLPNRFTDDGKFVEFNSVDVPLWFFEAVRSFLKYTGDYEFVKTNLYVPLKNIIDWYQRGTRYGIRMDDDGLLRSGEGGVALTWMDAKVGDWVVTPRVGKPVEIQALWYNALGVLSDLSQRFQDDKLYESLQPLIFKVQENFNQKFWNETAQCLYDVIEGPHCDGSIRPNQIFAVSLFYSVVSTQRAKAILSVVAGELLTPLGLRSLSPVDPQYRGLYLGDVAKRDSSYHQGTVWAWLMGPFISAYLKVNGRSLSNLQKVRQWLSGFEEHLMQAGVGQISEIFDGNVPHTPGGCIAQAWSVAEILRVLVEELQGSLSVDKSSLALTIDPSWIKYS